MQRKVDEKQKSDKEQSLLADAIKLINQLERLGINYQQMPADYGTAISKLPREKEAIVTSIYFGIEKIFVDLKVEFKYTNQQLLNL